MSSGIYNKLPVSFQNVACCFEGLRLKRLRYSKEFWRLLEQLELNGQMSEADVKRYRDHRIMQMVQFAAETVPYYRDLFRSIGLKPSDIRGLDDLSQLPILNKAEIQRTPERFFSQAVGKRDCIWAHTSGTTGAGLDFVTTPTAVRENYAAWWRYLRWHGLPHGTRCGYFGGRYIVPREQTTPPFWRENMFGRQVLFSAFHTTPDNLRYTVEKLRASKLRWLHGYPSHLTIIANYILDTGFELGYRPQWVTTCSESVLAHHRVAIRAAFGVNPLQHYAMAEAVANISECPAGNLHVDEDFSGVEFVPVGSDGLHRVIGTNLSNRATVFLRYDTGDLVRLASGKECPCGRHGRIVSSIEGRSEDNVVLPNGARICRFDHIFRGQVNISEAQIRQREIGAIDVLIVKNSQYAKADEDKILDGFRMRVGDSTDIELHYVDSIEKAANGKTRFVISHVCQNHASVRSERATVHEKECKTTIDH